MSDAEVTLTVTVTATIVSPCTIRYLLPGGGEGQTPRGSSSEVRFYVGTPESDGSSTWRYPASILGASSMRATVDGTTDTWSNYRRNCGDPSLLDGVYVQVLSNGSNDVRSHPSRPPKNASFYITSAG